MESNEEEIDYRICLKAYKSGFSKLKALVRAQASNMRNREIRHAFAAAEALQEGKCAKWSACQQRNLHEAHYRRTATAFYRRGLF